jgi:hypothetical protein
MEAEQSPSGGARISHDVTNESLAIFCLVLYLTRRSRHFVSARGLEENSLLALPQREEKTAKKQQDDESGNHSGIVGGFQCLCMAGNLRQCEFR